MANACLMPETGTTTSVRSGVSSNMRRKSFFLASNKKWTGPVIKKNPDYSETIWIHSLTW